MAHFAVEPFAAFFTLGTTPTSSDRPRLAQAYILRTADQRLIAIHLSSLEKFWDGLVAALEAPELGSDPRFCTRQARIDHYELLNAELDRRFGLRDLAHWSGRLGQHDVPFAPINTIDEVVLDPQVEHLGLIVPVAGAHGGASAVRPPVQFGGVRSRSVRAPPLLDEHGGSIREALSRGGQWPARDDEDTTGG
jgi:crotonobetainyl-CoA:carnitine CoA-transferase CaiB-like acyl-CoA transferase